MGQAFAELIRAVKSLFTWWVIVAPWEQGLRVRALPFGDLIEEVLEPGIHLRIPVFDRVYRQSVRVRTSTLEVQTVTTADGASVTVAGNLRYQISDLRKLYNELDHAEDTIRALAQATVAEAVVGLQKTDCTPMAVQEIAESHLDLTPYGIGEDVAITLTTFAFVRTYRLIQDVQHGGYGNVLDTADQLDAGQLM